MDQTNFAQSKVPKENLLVWNVKDGWGPLCEFLGKPIPDGPIPHDNKTGDTEFVQKILLDKPVVKEVRTYG